MPDKIPRIDVFSLKGGVGKTTISWLLARHIASNEGGNVLVLDADLTGTSLAEFVFCDETLWHARFNLAHLLVMEPERLPDVIGSRDLLATVDLSKGRVLLCQSHASSTEVKVNQQTIPQVDSRILHALLAQESAGGWINYVLDRVIESAASELGPLKAIVCDHSPGMGVIQEAAVGRPGSLKLFVTSCDLPDVSMVFRYMANTRKTVEGACFAFNRVKVNNASPNQGGLPEIPHWTDKIQKFTGAKEVFDRSRSFSYSEDCEQALRRTENGGAKAFPPDIFRDELGVLWGWAKAQARKNS